MCKTYEERKEFPPLYLETISTSEFVIFWQLEKVLDPIVIQLSPFVCKKNLPQQGLILGLTNTYPTVSRYPQRKKNMIDCFLEELKTPKSLRN